MRTVGEILKNTREKKEISLKEIEKATRIRAQYLEAIEKNDFLRLPGGSSITKGFIKNYAEFLGLSAKEVLAVFRRDYQESQTGEIIPHGMVHSLDRPTFAWSPKMTLGLGLVILFFVLGAYLFYQYFSLLAPPPLKIFSPQEGAKVSQSSLEVIGQTDADTTLFLNGEIKVVKEDGTFAEEVFLSSGKNEITIEVVSRRGKKSKIIRQVEFELGK